jgi:hypothetical protein
LSPRSDLGQRVADAIKAKGGIVVSVLPPRPGEQVRYEVRTAALADEIAAWLRERGFRVTDLGSVQRLVHNGVEEIIEVDLGDGVKRERVVTHPGLVMLHSFEVVIPDRPAGAIPNNPTPRPVPRPVKGPPLRRRRG